MSLWNPFYSTPAMYSYVRIYSYEMRLLSLQYVKNSFVQTKQKILSERYALRIIALALLSPETLTKKDELKETQTTTKS